MFFFTLLILIIPPVYLIAFHPGPYPPPDLCNPLPLSAED